MAFESGGPIREVWDMLRERKKYWLAPVILALMVIGVLLVITESSVVAPFIYSLF
jgi:hypothetical protein